MPELPEVETVCRGLENLLKRSPRLVEVQLERGDLRQPIRARDLKVLEGQNWLGVRRRAKYILFDFEKHVLINHLGMTGSWRLAAKGQEEKHDHLYLNWSGGLRLAFNDPRRFGMLQVVPRGNEMLAPVLKALGPEPLLKDFSPEWIFEKSRKRQTALKVWLMDQRNVVGVGNIYASEALFRAGVKPTRKTAKLTREEAKRLHQSVREVLLEAIDSGGSTIRDFRQADGGGGYFQQRLLVYDRADQPCRTCGGKISSQVLGGRSTYWCARCQK